MAFRRFRFFGRLVAPLFAAVVFGVAEVAGSVGATVGVVGAASAAIAAGVAAAPGGVSRVDTEVGVRSQVMERGVGAGFVEVGSAEEVKVGVGGEVVTVGVAGSVEVKVGVGGSLETMGRLMGTMGSRPVEARSESAGSGLKLVAEIAGLEAREEVTFEGT